MKRIIIRNTIVTAIAVLSLSFVAAGPVANAQNARAEEAQTTAQEKKDAAQTTATEKKAAAQTRLADSKLKACQNRETAITNIMARMSDRGQKQIDLFTTITERVETFYTDKGKTLATYDSLVTAVTDAKTDAQTAVDTTKVTSTGFSCDSDNPKGFVDSFKAAVKTRIDALNTYKTAVKNLIIGVKSVQSTAADKQTTQENQ
jgi:hypothetical protein